MVYKSCCQNANNNNYFVVYLFSLVLTLWHWQSADKDESATTPEGARTQKLQTPYENNRTGARCSFAYTIFRWNLKFDAVTYSNIRRLNTVFIFNIISIYIVLTTTKCLVHTLHHWRKSTEIKVVMSSYVKLTDLLTPSVSITQSASWVSLTMEITARHCEL